MDFVVKPEDILVTQQRSGLLGSGAVPYTKDNTYVEYTFVDPSFDANGYVPGEELESTLLDSILLEAQEPEKGIKVIHQKIVYDESGTPMNVITLVWDGKGQEH